MKCASDETEECLTCDLKERGYTHTLVRHVEKVAKHLEETVDVM